MAKFITLPTQDFIHKISSPNFCIKFYYILNFFQVDKFIKFKICITKNILYIKKMKFCKFT